MKSNPELSPFTSFNLLSAEISPFLLVNLMLLFVFFILFYLAYLVLKILELWILFSFRQKQNNGKTFTKFQLIVLKILRHIDIGLPLMFYLLFWVPICVFSSLNLKFGSSSSQTLFTASTFFSVVFLLVSLALIGLMAFYIFLLFKNTKRYVSTGIEHYCLNGFYDNLTLQHFPKNLQSVRTSSAQNKFHPRFGPYNLHFLNYINERPNDQSNLEELYKHIIDEKHHKKHKRNGHSISKKVPYNQVINENTQKNYLELLESPGWDGFNYRRPENINKLGLLHSNLTASKPVLFHFFYSIYHFVLLVNCVFMGLGILSPGIQIVSSFLLHFLLLVFFCFWRMYKHKLIFVFTVLVQSLFLLILLGFLMIYVDFKRDLTNSLGRERMGLFTIVMVFLWMLCVLLISVMWVVMRYNVPKKFKTMYYNQDFADETHLKFYREIPEMVYKMGQKAKKANETTLKDSNIIKTPSRPGTLGPLKYINSTSNNSLSIPRTNKFEVQTTPSDTLHLKDNNSSPQGLKIDQGDIVERDYMSEENNHINYNPKRSRAPNQFANNFQDSQNKKIAKIKLKDMEHNPYYQERNFNTTDRTNDANLNMGTLVSEDKKVSMQMKQSEMYNSHSYFYRNGQQKNEANKHISFEPKNLTENAKPEEANLNYSPSKNYLLENENRERKQFTDEFRNIENTNNMNYSYSQFANPENQLRTYTNSEHNKPLEQSEQTPIKLKVADNDPNKHFFTNENLTKIMGQDSQKQLSNPYPEEAIEPINTIQLKHSHFVLKERFGKANDLK